MKGKKNLFIFTSILCLLPMILSAILYSQLPDQITVHWDSAGQPDGYLPKSLTAIGLPFLFLILNTFAFFRLTNDPKRSAHSKAAEILNIWLIPCTSLILIPITLFIAVGANIPITTIVPLIAGIILIITGNYLPKNRLNYTIGVRTPWSLDNVDNWNKTNRLAGYLLIFWRFCNYNNFFYTTKDYYYGYILHILSNTFNLNTHTILLHTS